MNNVYKIRWNKIKALWECVSEMSKNAVRSKKTVTIMTLSLLGLSSVTNAVWAGDINEPSFNLENGYVVFDLNPSYGGYFDEKGVYHFGDGNQLANSSTFTRDFLENFAKTHENYKNNKLSAEQTQLPFRVRVTPGPHGTHPLLMDNQYRLLEGMKADDKSYFLADGTVNPDYDGDVLILSGHMTGFERVSADSWSSNGQTRPTTKYDGVDYIVQAPDSKMVLDSNSSAYLTGLMMAGVHNELKGYVVTTSLWIGNGGRASDTSMGGATVELQDWPSPWWSYNAIYINFNDEEAYELGESSLGGKLIASINRVVWDDEEASNGLHIIGTGVTRVTGLHEFNAPVNVYNGTLQFEDHGYLHKSEYSVYSIWTGNENPGTIAYKIQSNDPYYARESFYGKGKLLKKGAGTLVYDNRDGRQTSLEPLTITIYFLDEDLEYFAWYLDQDGNPIKQWNKELNVPITDPSRGLYSLAHTYGYGYRGEHHYEGSTLIAGGTFLLETGNVLTATPDIQIFAQDDTDFATFHMRGEVNEKAHVIIGENANPGSQNTFLVDGSRFNGLHIEQRSQPNDTVHSNVVLTNNSTLFFSESGEAFTGFHTDEQTGEDRIELGEGATTFDVAEGKTVTQFSEAAISDLPGVSNPGTLVKDGEGTLVLTASNRFQGPLHIKAGTVRVASTASLGANDTVLLGSTPAESEATPEAMARATAPEATTTARLNVDNTAEMVLNRNLKGNGSLVKTNTGDLILTKDHHYGHTGPTVVRDGTLVLAEGAGLKQSALTVENATLSASVGEHDLNGVTFNEGSTTDVRAENLTTYSQLKSQGDVKLAGELKVEVKALASVEDFDGPKLKNVITSETSLAGEFASYSDNSVLFNFIPEYHRGDEDGQAMHLVVQAAEVPETKPDRCARKASPLECIIDDKGDEKLDPVAPILDDKFKEDPDSPISQEFYGLDDEDKVVAAVESALPLMTGSLNSVMQNRVDRLARYGYDTQAPFVKTQDDGANLWVNIAQNYSRQDADRGATGWTDNATEIALGRDVPIWDGQTRIGLMAGYATGEVKSKGTAAEHKADVDVYQLGLYGKHHSEAMDLAFRAGYAYAKVDGERRLNWVNKTAKSDTHADILYAGVKVSKPMAWATPFASLNTHWVRSAGYQEQGAGVLDLDVLKQTRQSAVLMGGVDFQKSLKDGRFNVAATAGLGVELLDTENEIDAAFRGLPGKYFTTESADCGRMVGKFALKASCQMTENTSLAAGYQLDWREGFQSQTGNVKLEIAF